MSNPCSFRSPAKINLALCILGKRPDGFHELDTIMIRTSLYDVITLSVHSASQNDIDFTCTNPLLPTGSKNLAVRAAELFLKQLAKPYHIAIHLEKKIPTGAGLGGGSSNAATVLTGLNQLINNPLSKKNLNRLAMELGSDVPFFLVSQPVARCRGRGEIVKALKNTVFPQRAILINPGFSVPTDWAYRTYSSLPLEKKRGEEGTAYHWGSLRNDLEPAVFSKYLLLPEIKKWLLYQKNISAALMSGSGSTIFGLMNANANFSQLELEFRKSFGMTTFVADIKLSH